MAKSKKSSKTKSTAKKSKKFDYSNIIQVIIIIAIVVVAFFIGALSKEVNFYKNQDSSKRAIRPSENNVADQEGTQPTGEISLAAPSTDDHIRGNEDATYALIEYSDFDCPFCTRFHQTGIEFIEDMGEEVMWVYRHFPLYGAHPNAESKAVASECAALQGGDAAFWAYSDELFLRQEDEVSSDDKLREMLIEIALEIGLNTNQFASCYDNQETLSAIEEDIQSAQDAGVSGTPGNYLLNIETGESTQLRGAVPLDVVKNALVTIQ